MSTFSPFFVWPVWLTAVKKRRETQINRCSCSFNIIAPFQSPPLLNLAPCYIMEYFASNINVIRSQVKENRTYADISNLFRQNFPEVRRGFSEKNVRLFALILLQTWHNQNERCRGRCHHSRLRERGELTFYSAWMLLHSFKMQMILN